jgi:hypothetical protein
MKNSLMKSGDENISISQIHRPICFLRASLIVLMKLGMTDLSADLTETVRKKVAKNLRSSS